MTIGLFDKVLGTWDDNGVFLIDYRAIFIIIGLF